MKQISKIFLTGVAVGAPLILTIVVIWMTGQWLNGVALNAVRSIWPAMADVLDGAWGMGILLILGVIFLIGLAARFWMTAWILRLMSRILERVPLAKTIYTSIRDMLRFFGDDSGSLGKVVPYTTPDTSARMLAILTNERPVGLPADQAEDMVAIWLPMSYMLGGYMLCVPADSIEPLDMSVERLMKLATTAEVGAWQMIEEL